MRRLTMRSFGLFIFAFGTAVAAAAPIQPCSLNFLVPPDRVFAQMSGTNAWQEYQSIDKVPDLGTDGGISAELWRRSDGNLSVRTDEPGEDFLIYTRYCFLKDGRLERIAFEIRTAWGWGCRLNAAIEKGAIHASRSEFFDTATERSIPRPEQANDIAEALKPKLYLSAEQLPFFSLITGSSKSVSRQATH